MRLLALLGCLLYLPPLGAILVGISCCPIRYNVQPAAKSVTPAFDKKEVYHSLIRVFATGTSQPACQQEGDAATSSFPEGASYERLTALMVEGFRKSGTLTGSGFAITEDFFVTAGHVCGAINLLQMTGELDPGIFMEYYNNDLSATRTEGGLEIIGEDATNDVCVLQKMSHGIKPIGEVVTNIYVLFPHDTLYIVGSPAGQYARTSEGELMNRNYSVEDMNHKLLIYADVFGGDSGGPIFNDKGELVGMLIAGFRSYHHLAIGTRSDILVESVRHIFAVAALGQK